MCHGELIRSSLGVLSVVGRWNEARYKRSKRDGNLNKSTFANTHTFGGRAYPVRHYPIAVRLRDRKGRAILCSHYSLSVGTLRVLHSECVPSHSFTLVLPWFLLGLLYGAHIQGTKEGNLNNRTFYVPPTYSYF